MSKLILPLLAVVGLTLKALGRRLAKTNKHTSDNSQLEASQCFVAFVVTGTPRSLHALTARLSHYLSRYLKDDIDQVPLATIAEAFPTPAIVDVVLY